MKRNGRLGVVATFERGRAVVQVAGRQVVTDRAAAEATLHEFATIRAARRRRRRGRGCRAGRRHGKPTGR